MNPSTLAFAHRGWHRHHIENTMGALDAAYAAGCDGVEFDVQLTVDGVAVLFHDDDLQRLAGRPDRICDLKWSELRDIPVHLNGQRSAIPTLDAFLTQHGQRPFYLEVKVPQARQEDRTYCERLAWLCLDAVQKGKPHSQTFLASFHLPLMTWLKANHPQYPFGIIYEDEATLESVLGRAPAHPKERAWLHSLEAGLWQNRRANRKALPDASTVWLWGLRTESEMEQALQANLAGLVVDDVPTLLQLMGRS
jgi:glycerophosphoryl diester phosphodiesterase